MLSRTHFIKAAASLLAFYGCGTDAIAQSSQSTPPPSLFGMFVETDPVAVSKMPAEPMTAILGTGFDRVSAQVNSPAACLNAGVSQVYNVASNKFIQCMDRDGITKIVSWNGKLYTLKK